MKISELDYIDNIEIRKTDSLLIVDMQYDFLPGGALAVEDGDQIIEGINNVAEKFYRKDINIVQTQDWHPSNHKSFASAYKDKVPGDEFISNEGAIGPVLWPDHCVQESKGAMFHEDLNTKYTRAIIRKGYHEEVDSYSAFLENDKETKTGLDGYLKSLGVERIFIGGLALDYCCFYSAMDAIDYGFEVFFIVDLSKGIDNPPGNISKALDEMKSKGVKFVHQESF